MPPKDYWIYDNHYKCAECQRYIDKKFLIHGKKIYCGICKVKNSVRIKPHRKVAKGKGKEHYNKKYI